MRRPVLALVSVLLSASFCVHFSGSAFAQGLAALPTALQETTAASHPGKVALAAGAVRFEAADLTTLGVKAGEIATRVWIDVKPASGAAASLDPFVGIAAASRDELDLEAAFPGDDKALAQRMSHAPCIVLTGGTWSDWWVCTNPRHKLTRLGSAILDAHRRGALVVGVGASAAYLAEWSVLERSAITRPVRDPHEEGLDVVAEGLGLVEGVCIDLELGGRTTPSRMLRATREGNVTLAVWLAGPVVWIDDAGANTSTVLGPGAALAFDLRTARRDREDIAGGRLSAIVGGVTLDRRALTYAGPATARSTAAQLPPRDASVPALESARIAATLATDAIAGPLELCDAIECLSIALDERSLRVSGSWTNARFDLHAPRQPRERAGQVK